MTDTTFRTAQPQADPESTPKPTETHSVSTSNVEVPYLDYEREKGKPFIAEHYDLGERWMDRDGGFKDEVFIIESYFQNEITDRRIDNSIKGVKDRLKEIEKVTGMDKENRAVIKMEVIAEYLKFLSKRRDIEKNIQRYS